MDLLQLLISKSNKPILPTIVIATHGKYKFIENVTGTGIDTVEDIGIEMKKLPSGMKVHKLETAPLGIGNYLSTYDVNHVCSNIQKYMCDERSIEMLVKDLVEITEKKNERFVIKKHDDIEKSFVKKVRQGQMNTFQNIDGSLGQSYYEKEFSRNLDGDDKICYYDMKINLILPEKNLLSKITTLVFPKTIDIYDKVIEYQDKKGYIYDILDDILDDEKEEKEKHVYLSGIINYMNDELNIKEFIIVDLTCSTFRFHDKDDLIFYNHILRHDDAIAENERVIRQLNRSLLASNKSKSYVVSSKRKKRKLSPNGGTKRKKTLGGKQIKCSNFRNKKSNRKTRKNKGCISR